MVGLSYLLGAWLQTEGESTCKMRRGLPGCTEWAKSKYLANMRCSPHAAWAFGY